MRLNQAEFEQQYSTMLDEELAAIRPGDLNPVARECYQREMERRTKLRASTPPPPSSRGQVLQTAVEVESSEIKGWKAALYVVIMVLTYCFVCLADYDNPKAASINGGVFKAQLFGACAAWAISKILPDGWLNALRTAIFALAVNLALVGWVFLR